MTHRCILRRCPTCPSPAGLGSTNQATAIADGVRYLIRDQAGQFTDGCDAVFAAEGIEVLRSARG